MVENQDLYNDLNKKIEDIQNKVLLGEINLLDLELVPLFDDIKNILTIYNIYDGSKTYSEACRLLNQKFQELQIIISSLDNENKILEYLESNPKDTEIYQLYEGCWRNLFTIDTLSLNFLKFSKDKLSNRKETAFSLESLEKEKLYEEFYLELPKEKFTEKMMRFFNSIKKKLPCAYDEIFEDEDDQIKIYEHFVYLLHLLQLGKIKYQKDTKFLYL
ncbi:MAG: hypothetical protein ACFE8L_14000 [Candidatus Hodarchaeota archaeon]